MAAKRERTKHRASRPGRGAKGFAAPRAADGPAPETAGEAAAGNPKAGKAGGKGGLTVVGIGASAGGLEALKHLLPGLPAGLGFAYVVVQHMDPHHKSLLAELLVPSTAMPVREIKDGEPIRADIVYINPPNSNLHIRGGRLYLTRPQGPFGPHPSVNLFFKYLADEFGERGVGIILSGTGSDGADGIRAIKAAGGLTLAQQESTAKFNGMPRSAIATGSVDLAIPPQEMGRALSGVLADTPEHGAPPEGDPEKLAHVFKAVLKSTGVDFSGYKLPTVSRRIARRMSVVRTATLDEYSDYLAGHPDEAEALRKDLLISVTSFFRDKKSFEALEKHVGSLLKRKKPGDDIRIWVPGCATGEEVYSLAIILDRLLGKDYDRYRVTLFGTDLDETGTAFARQGNYSEASLEGLPRGIVERYFVKEKASYRVRPDLRQKVVFARHDLTREPPFMRMDLITCRNLLIYFLPDLQNRIFALFHYSLVEDGLLFLGKSESVTRWPELFAVVDKRHKIFQRRNVDTRKYLDPVRHLHLAAEFARPKARTARVQVPGLGIPAQLVHALGLKGFLLNGSNNILHLIGNVEPFIRIADGDFVNNVFNFIHPDLRVDLRSVLKQSQDKRQAAKSRMLRPSGLPGMALTLHATPWQAGEGVPSDCFLALIQEHPAPAAEPAGAGRRQKRPADADIRALEQEIEALKEQLGTTTEEMESSNEELQSLTEELQSSNEELQSANEELETSNEELQSSNEELTTVNEELQVKSAELAAVLGDIESLMRNMNFGILVVDARLRVTRFNDIAAQYVENGLISQGDGVTNIPFRFSMPKLKEQLGAVLRGAPPRDEMIASQGRVLWLRITSTLDANNAVAGAVLAFLDVTERESDKLGLKRSEAQMRTVLDCIGMGLVVVDGGTRLLLANAEAHAWLGTSLPAQGIESWLDLGLLRPDGSPMGREEFPLAVALKGGLFNGQARFERSGRAGFLEVTSRPLPDGAGAVMAFRDVTEKVRQDRETARRLEFRTLVGRIASAFVTGPIEDAGLELIRSLQELAAFAGAETSCLFQLDPEGSCFRLSYSGNGTSSRSPLPAGAHELALGEFPYFASALSLGQPVMAMSEGGLPALAGAEKDFLAGQGLFPALLIPLLKDRRLFGFIGFFRKHASAEWDEEEVAALAIIGNLLASVLERQNLTARLDRSLSEREKAVR